jgi:hypothetical protein
MLCRQETFLPATSMPPPWFKNSTSFPTDIPTMTFKRRFLSALFCLIISNSFAQTVKELAMKHIVDSIKMAVLSDYATRNPILRQGSLSTDIIGSSHINAQLNGKALYSGDMNVTRVRSNFNIPLAQWGKNSISYERSDFETRNIQSFDPAFSSANRSTIKTAAGFTVTYTRSDSVFNHPIYFSGGISGLTDELSSVKRINYLGTVTVPISRNQTSALTLGLLVIIDPSAIAPVIPVISYWRKLSPSLDLYADIPQRLVVRKQLSKRSWAFAGSELGGNLYFFNINQPGLPQNDIFSSIEIRSGATFEYLATKKLVLGINGGCYTTASPRLFDHNDKPTAYFLKTNGGSAPYISFTISFLPFLKSLK